MFLHMQTQVKNEEKKKLQNVEESASVDNGEPMVSKEEKKPNMRERAQTSVLSDRVPQIEAQLAQRGEIQMKQVELKIEIYVYVVHRD